MTLVSFDNDRMISIDNERLVIDFLEEQLDDEDVVQQAWTELMEIGKEQERYAEMRAVAEKELEACRKRSILLEDVRQKQIKTFFLTNSMSKFMK